MIDWQELSLDQVLQQTRSYLTERLIPFWAERIYEPQYGGFQTNYNRHGERTPSDVKTLLCQARSLFTIAFVRRQGLIWANAEEQLAGGLAFLLDHCRDLEQGGFYWIVDQRGNAVDDSKVLYGQSFVIYALAELALLTGEQQPADEAVRLFDLMQARCRDDLHGGYVEHFGRDWRPRRARGDQPLHKSLDVHMHLMEAFTTLYELTGAPQHRTALDEVAELLWTRMVEPTTGAGISMFRTDWTPIANVELETVWGSDRFAGDKSPEITSYGHNIELAWLYLHALDILGRERQAQSCRAVRTMRHTLEHGVDWGHGGLWVEGQRSGGPTERNKEFWQQAEALVGFLDAYLLTGETAFLSAFRNVHTFVFGKMINWPIGEWFPLLDEAGNVLWDYAGHEWKICYHTVRSMVLTVSKLEKALAPGRRKGRDLTTTPGSGS